MLKRIERDLDTMRAQGRFGAAPALPAVEYVPKDDGLLNTLVRQQPVFEPQPGNATIAAKKQRRSKGTENDQPAEPFVVKEGSKQPRTITAQPAAACEKRK